MIKPVIKLAALTLVGTAFTASAALAQVKLPPTITMTAYDTGTSGFNITVAIGKMLKDKYGSDARVLPAGNDVARLQPLRAGRASISAMGVGVFFAQEINHALSVRCIRIPRQIEIIGFDFKSLRKSFEQSLADRLRHQRGGWKTVVEGVQDQHALRRIVRAGWRAE